MVTETRCRPNWYLRLLDGGVNLFKNAKRTHVACGPVRCPCCGRSTAVDCDPVRPCGPVPFELTGPGNETDFVNIRA